MDNGAYQRYQYKLLQDRIKANSADATKRIEARQLDANNAETQRLVSHHPAPPPEAPPALTYVPVTRRDGLANRQYLARTMQGEGRAPNADAGPVQTRIGSTNMNLDPAQRAALKKQTQGKTLTATAAGAGQGNRGVDKEVRVVASSNSTGGPARYQSTVVAQSESAVRLTTAFPPNLQDIPAELTKNVLHNYRSHTYTFTLSGLASSVFSGPVSTDDYRQKSEGLMILSSAGKGNSKIVPGKNVVENKKILNPESIYTGDKPIIEENNSQKLINDFNKESPGRFDMFIDNVEIDSLFSFNKNSTITLPQSLRFEVYEPYGINGFVEALHVAAVAAGYVNYAEACFLLTMKFSGYPDGPGLPEVETEIKNATKYFPIKITGFQVDLTERGSRYTCTAIPYSDDGFIDFENRLKQNIQVKGITVNDILTNFLHDLTEQRKASDKAIREAPAPDYDEFKVAFISPSSSAQAMSNYLKNSEFTEYGKENQIFVFNNPQTVAGKTGYDGKSSGNKQSVVADGPANDPKSSSINFAADTNITDCITAVITGSKWHRDLLKTLTEANRIDEFGMVNYFAIRMEVTNKSSINELKNRPFQIYTYVITNYKIHYTRIPNYEGTPFDWSKLDLSKIAYRKYDYLFMGQNVDVINFKIHFDNLYFEAVARAMGNSDAYQSKSTIAYPDALESKTDNKPKIDKLTKKDLPVLPNVPKKEMLPDTKNPTATQPQWKDPYYHLSKSMYQAVINSNTAMVKGEIEILGDPFFLTMGGFNNYRPESAGYGVSKDGSVDIFQGQVFIQIKFRNPEDINTFADGGTAKFSKNAVSFNGIYMVNKVKSTFKSGVFKQVLQMIRMVQAEKPDTITESPAPLASVDSEEKHVTDAKADNYTSLGDL